MIRFGSLGPTDVLFVKPFQLAQLAQAVHEAPKKA